ncbi:MAG: hypothetical protein NTX17_10970 [Candidatus Eisenbacteria bacterium]|nr:hypothetical protein [Candidatus Eisenbacteria bacterium]
MRSRILAQALVITASLLISGTLIPPPVSAGSFNARRLGMGGVVLSEYSEAQNRNVSFRAVPRGKTHWNIPLPLGIIQVLASPPELDPDNADFNPFEIADLVTNFPVFLRLKKPDVIEDDIVIDIARDRLAIDLGDIARVVPEESFKLGGLLDQPEVGLNVRGVFAGLSPLVVAKSDFSLSQSLKDALGEGDDFLPNTSYSMKEDAEAQAGLALGVGYARRLNAVLGDQKEDPRFADELAVFAGGRFKYIMGFAYAKADPIVSFTTGDTLFGDEPLGIDFESMIIKSLPDDGFGIMGNGTGLDLGASAFRGGYEVGLGLTNVVTKIHWKADREFQVLDDSTNDIEKYTLAEDFDYTSTVPLLVVFNAAKRWRGNTLAFDIEKGVTRTSFHLGGETAMKNVALRTGTWLDANGKLQFSAGAGFRLWVVGLDMALITSSSVLTGDRAVDLALSLSL